MKKNVWRDPSPPRFCSKERNAGNSLDEGLIPMENLNFMNNIPSSLGNLVCRRFLVYQTDASVLLSTCYPDKDLAKEQERVGREREGKKVQKKGDSACLRLVCGLSSSVNRAAAAARVLTCHYLITN